MTSVRPCVLLLTLLETLGCVLGPASYTRATAHPAVVSSYQGVRAGLALAVILRTLLDDQVKIKNCQALAPNPKPQNPKTKKPRGLGPVS